MPLQAQHELKAQALSALFAAAQIPAPHPEVLDAGKAWLRDRADLSYEEGRWGFYERDTRRILDIEVCAQFSPALQSWFQDLRRQAWPIRKGSFRLRVSPAGERGLWLDFANLDIKNLLTEKNLLRELQSQAIVEIGQRFKRLIAKDQSLGLSEPVLRSWFQTWIDDKVIPLYGPIGGFTQPSLKANRLLTSVIASWLQGSRRILEFGSGNGNLSLPALGQDRELIACEIDENALQGFRWSLAEAAKYFSDIEERVHITQGDFQNRAQASFAGIDTVLVNPPRSGLKNFLKPLLAETKLPENFIYMSCFPESLIQDAKNLVELGYRLQDLKIVDQFPQTAHYEVLSQWRRSL